MLDHSLFKIVDSAFGNSRLCIINNSKNNYFFFVYFIFVYSFCRRHLRHRPAFAVSGAPQLQKQFLTSNERIYVVSIRNKKLIACISPFIFTFCSKQLHLIQLQTRINRTELLFLHYYFSLGIPLLFRLEKNYFHFIPQARQ